MSALAWSVRAAVAAMAPRCGRPSVASTPLPNDCAMAPSTPLTPSTATSPPMMSPAGAKRRAEPAATRSTPNAASTDVTNATMNSAIPGARIDFENGTISHHSRKNGVADPSATSRNSSPIAPSQMIIRRRSLSIAPTTASVTLSNPRYSECSLRPFGPQ